MKLKKRTEKTNRKKDGSNLRLTLLEKVVDSIPDGILAVDCEGKAFVWNRAAEEMTGLSKQELPGRGECAYAAPFYGKPGSSLVDILLGRGREWEHGKIEQKGRVLAGEGFAPYGYGGRGLHFWAFAAPIYDEAGNLLGAVQSVRDIGERKQMEEGLRLLGIRDSLTGLYNRSYFEEEMLRLEKGRGYPVSLILCDIDGLKSVNDSLGHIRGDELLRRTGKVIAGCVRGSDLAARVGGDEFVVVLPQTDREAANEVARRIVQAVAEDNAGHPGFHLSISLGTATAEDASCPLIHLYKIADEAMYSSKRACKDQMQYARGKLDGMAISLAFSQKVHETLDVEEVARWGLEMVLDVTGAVSGAVEILQEGQEGWTSETVAALGPGSEVLANLDKDVVDAVRREGRAVHFDSCCQTVTAYESRSAVAVPITADGPMIGVLTVKGQPGYFSENLVAFLTDLGGILGHALHNASIYRQQKKKAFLMEKLIGLRWKMACAQEEKTAFKVIMAGVEEFISSSWCVLRLLDKKTGELVMVSSSGLSEALTNKISRVRPEGNLLGLVIQEKKVISVNDLDAAATGLKLPYYCSEMKAFVVAPVFAGGDIIGTLKIYSPIPRLWSEDEISFLTAVAEMLGLTLADLRLHASLRQQSLKIVLSLSAAQEHRDKYTRGHAERVARLAVACARALDMAQEQQEHLLLAAMVHDIGKIGVADTIILKPGHLDQAEWEEVKKHPVMGADIVKEGDLPEAVVLAVRHHHEDWSGGGYPDSLAGEEIPLLARIIRVADTYDAMITDRPYRRRIMAAEAIELLRRGAGRQFDPRVVKAFLQISAIEMEEIGVGGGVPFISRFYTA